MAKKFKIAAVTGSLMVAGALAVSVVPAQAAVGCPSSVSGVPLNGGPNPATYNNARLDHRTGDTCFYIGTYNDGAHAGIPNQRFHTFANFTTLLAFPGW
jgi:hypothetical protein